MTIHLTINNNPIQAQTGQTILQAAQANGLTIPTLCYHKDLSPAGSCRLCVVEVEGWRGELAACTTQVSEGMIVHTETPALRRSRKMILEMLLQNYYDNGYALGDHVGDTEFEKWVIEYEALKPIEIQQFSDSANQQTNKLASQPITNYQLPNTQYLTPHLQSPISKINSDPNPFIWVDMNKCILCTRCVRACAEIQGRFVWGVGERGGATKIIAGNDTTLLDARCESCGACVAYCPTGALDNKLSMGLGKPEKVITTTCSYCGVGCQFDLHVRDNKILRVVSNPDAQPNGMHLCVKGRYGYDYVNHPDRLTKPKVRRYLLDNAPKPEAMQRFRASANQQPSKPANEQTNKPITNHQLPITTPWDWVETDWHTALDLIARKVVQVRRESGVNAIGVMSSAKCTNEENYLMNKFARQVVGTHNIDHCARLCHAPTVAGLAAAYGSGAMTNPFRDTAENAKAVLIIGSNTTEQHPVFGSMLRQAVLQRGLKIVVADPRRIDIAEYATPRYGGIHIRQKPGTDVALINGLMHIILKNGWEDKAYIEARTENFEALKEVVAKYPPEIAAQITGIPVEQLHQAAEILALNKPMAVIWAMGITQHTKGVLNVMSLANLQMLLGNIGIPGGGVNPLRGQNNVQGACDMGGLPNVFPAYQPVTSPEAREKFEKAWELDGRPRAEDRFPFSGPPSPVLFGDKPGLTVTEMVNLAGEGKVRLLYILGENPLMSDPDVNHARACLGQAEFVVLQEIFPSETSEFADVLLPGVSFAEKDGTFTNSERRLRLVQKALEPVGEARPDWEIIADLARRVLALEGREPVGPQAGWQYAHPREIMAEISVLAPSYAGVTHARLAAGEQLHWPVKSLDHPGTPILHIGQFARGKGKFHACEHLDAKELPDEEYPYYLNTGRVLYHWHGAEMTRRAEGLLEVYPEALVEISPEDAVKIGINGKDPSTTLRAGRVRVTSRRGEMIARAIVTERVSAGMIFANFHFPGAQNANNLTIAALDPTAKIPEFKVCAVRVEMAE
ncbi:MAG: formate dehydrogenase subunit alpha [Anaerolineales bacterium]